MKASESEDIICNMHIIILQKRDITIENYYDMLTKKWLTSNYQTIQVEVV